MSKTTAPLESVIRRNENIYWQGHPEKLPFMYNNIIDYLPDIVLSLIFNVVLCPILIFKYHPFNIVVSFIIIILWIIQIFKLLQLLSIPLHRKKEWKNIYYIITDKHFYIQFGQNDQIFYRMYPIDRLGTKVFYRKNTIDNIFGVGTIGVSVDDYYEERLISINDFEDVYKIFKGYTDVRKVAENEKKKEEARKEAEEIEREKKEQEELEKRRKEEEEKQRKLDLEKESMFTDTLDDNINNNTTQTTSYDEYKKRSLEILEEARRNELRKEDARRRAEEARRRHEKRQKEMQQEQAKKDEIGLMPDYLDDYLMEEEKPQTRNKPKQSTGPKRNGKKPKYKYNDNKKFTTPVAQKEDIKNDGDEDKKPPKKISDKELQTMDLSVLWNKKD